MDHQKQTQQTETLIKEMLEFLDSTSEEEDDPGKLTANTFKTELQETNNKKNGEDLLKALNEKDKKSKSSLAKELIKLKQQYPIWNTKEIGVSKHIKASHSQKSPAAIAKPIWHKSSLSLLDKSDEPAEGDVLPPNESDLNDFHTNFETNYRHSSSNAYTQEVQKAIYGDTTGHPSSDSADYYQAAQNYAIYGKDFLDFPENLQCVMNNKSTPSTDNLNYVTNNFGNGLYPTPQSQVLLNVNGSNCNAPVGFNNFGIPNTSSSNTVGTSSAAAAVASTAAYYQMCNGMQPQTRQMVGNVTAANAQGYGIFLGNKVTYVAAAPTAPYIVYNQPATSTTNFVSNSLANAALASSPAILYSNPVLTTTTQQCLNTFFKETQFICSGAAAVNSAQGSAAGTANTTGIYERLVYAQMLQQQIYHQTQQAAAVAAMFQHKQRVAAAAAAAASIRQTTNGTNSTLVTNGNNAVAPPATSVATTSNNSNWQTIKSAKVCNNSNYGSRHSPVVGHNLVTDLLQIKQQNATAANSGVIAAKGPEEVPNVLKD